MRVVHLIYSFNTGGSETMLVDIVNDQIKRVDVNIIIINKNYNELLLSKIDNKVKVHFINRIENSKNPISIIKLNLMLFELNVDVIHCHNHNIIPLLIPFFKRKSVLTLHCMGIPTKFLSKYKKLFAISESVRKDIISRKDINVKLIYNGISIKSIEKKETTSSVHFFKIICVGRLDHNIKGQHLIIETLQILKEKGVNNILLDFIGIGESEDYLKKMVLKFQLNRQVNFLGLKERDYIYKNLKNYNLLVQPSLFEGFGLTVVESMSAKVPVLVSDINGPMEIIENGKYGFHFKTGNAKNLAEQLQNIISIYSSENFKQKVDDAYNHVKENFDISSTALKYLQNY